MSEFTVRVDPLNPGQYFAALGLFELASRLVRDCDAGFEDRAFTVRGGPSLTSLMTALGEARLVDPGREGADAPDDSDGDDDDDEIDRSAVLELGAPFGLRLDWWRDQRLGMRDLKVWAGKMDNIRIAQAMQGALGHAKFQHEGLLDECQVVRDPTNRAKVEPFYFDSRRAANAHRRDVGFSPDALSLTTNAYPAVELLCLIGLQRFRPQPAPNRGRLFTYQTWRPQLPIELAAPAAGCSIEFPGSVYYRFESWFRDGQKKNKAFRAATIVTQGESDARAHRT